MQFKCCQCKNTVNYRLVGTLLSCWHSYCRSCASRLHNVSDKRFVCDQSPCQSRHVDQLSGAILAIDCSEFKQLYCCEMCDMAVGVIACQDCTGQPRLCGNVCKQSHLIMKNLRDHKLRPMIAKADEPNLQREGIFSKKGEWAEIREAEDQCLLNEMSGLCASHHRLYTQATRTEDGGFRMGCVKCRMTDAIPITDIRAEITTACYKRQHQLPEVRPPLPKEQFAELFRQRRDLTVNLIQSVAEQFKAIIDREAIKLTQKADDIGANVSEHRQHYRHIFEHLSDVIHYVDQLTLSKSEGLVTYLPTILNQMAELRELYQQQVNPTQPLINVVNEFFYSLQSLDDSEIDDQPVDAVSAQQLKEALMKFLRLVPGLRPFLLGDFKKQTQAAYTDFTNRHNITLVQLIDQHIAIIDNSRDVQTPEKRAALKEKFTSVRGLVDGALANRFAQFFRQAFVSKQVLIPFGLYIAPSATSTPQRSSTNSTLDDSMSRRRSVMSSPSDCSASTSAKNSLPDAPSSPTPMMPKISPTKAHVKLVTSSSMESSEDMMMMDALPHPAGHVDGQVLPNTSNNPVVNGDHLNGDTNGNGNTLAHGVRNGNSNSVEPDEDDEDEELEPCMVCQSMETNAYGGGILMACINCEQYYHINHHIPIIPRPLRNESSQFQCTFCRVKRHPELRFEQRLMQLLQTPGVFKAIGTRLLDACNAAQSSSSLNRQTVIGTVTDLSHDATVSEAVRYRITQWIMGMSKDGY